MEGIPFGARVLASCWFIWVVEAHTQGVDLKGASVY